MIFEKIRNNIEVLEALKNSIHFFPDTFSFGLTYTKHTIFQLCLGSLNKMSWDWIW